MYETMLTRHTTMIVGPTGGGKSVVINTLCQSQTKWALFTPMGCPEWLLFTVHSLQGHSWFSASGTCIPVHRMQILICAQKSRSIRNGQTRFLTGQGDYLIFYAHNTICHFFLQMFSLVWVDWFRECRILNSCLSCLWRALCFPWISSEINWVKKKCRH